MEDLFGDIHQPKKTLVRLYADEIKPYRNPIGEQWQYIGILAIPEERHDVALTQLKMARGESGYDGEVHFSKLTRRPKINLAKKWISYVMWDQDGTFYFYILGINRDNLTPEVFGRGRDYSRSIYNRFFRSASLYALKTYFGHESVVTAIFHDKGDMEQNELFDWHSIWRIASQEPGISFLTNQIEFIDSDHRKEPIYSEESHFIQLIDIILGATTQCLDSITRRHGCNEVAQSLLPLIERLVDPGRISKPHSRYNYFRRCSISFFPCEKLSLKELRDPFERVRSYVYISRRILLKEALSGQVNFLDILDRTSSA